MNHTWNIEQYQPNVSFESEWRQADTQWKRGIASNKLRPLRPTVLRKVAFPAEQTPQWRGTAGKADWWWTSWSSWATQPGSWERPSIWQRQNTNSNMKSTNCSGGVVAYCLLGNLENPQKSQRPQHTDTKRHARPEEAIYHLNDAAHNNLQKKKKKVNCHSSLAAILKVLTPINFSFWHSQNPFENLKCELFKDGTLWKIEFLLFLYIWYSRSISIAQC